MQPHRAAGREAVSQAANGVGVSSLPGADPAPGTQCRAGQMQFLLSCNMFVNREGNKSTGN